MFMQIQLLMISSLWREALLTMVPANNTGLRLATGVMAPVLPTWYVTVWSSVSTFRPWIYKPSPNVEILPYSQAVVVVLRNWLLKRSRRFQRKIVSFDVPVCNKFFYFSKCFAKLCLLRCFETPGFCFSKSSQWDSAGISSEIYWYKTDDSPRFLTSPLSCILRLPLAVFLGFMNGSRPSSSRCLLILSKFFGLNKFRRA